MRTDERGQYAAAWREAPFYTDAERAALALTEAATRLQDGAPGVTDDIWDDATKHFTEDQVGRDHPGDRDDQLLQPHQPRHQAAARAPGKDVSNRRSRPGSSRTSSWLRVAAHHGCSCVGEERGLGQRSAAQSWTKERPPKRAADLPRAPAPPPGPTGGRRSRKSRLPPRVLVSFAHLSGNLKTSPDPSWEAGGPRRCSRTAAALDHPAAPHRRTIVNASVTYPAPAAHLTGEVPGTDRLLRPDQGRTRRRDDLARLVRARHLHRRHGLHGLLRRRAHSPRACRHVVAAPKVEPHAPNPPSGRAGLPLLLTSP